MKRSSQVRWWMSDYKILHILPHLKRRGAPVTSSDLFFELRRRGLGGKLLVIFSGQDQIGISNDPDVVCLKVTGGTISAVRSLKAFISQYVPDIILAHGGEPFKYAALARGRRKRPFLIYRKIGLSDMWLKRLRRTRLVFHSKLLKSVDAVISIGKGTRDELVDLFHVSPDKISVIYRGYGIGDFSSSPDARARVRAELGISHGVSVLISVGHLAWEKNHRTMLRVLKALKTDFPEAVLLLVGDGPERESLERYAEELGLADSVIFTGSRSDVPELLKAADVFLLTSLTEGVPGVLIEAGLSGLPCVTWDVAGAGEVVQDGATGFVTPYEDEGKIIESTKRILLDPQLTQELGENAKKFCKERFDINRCVDEFIKVFEGLLA